MGPARAPPRRREPAPRQGARPGPGPRYLSHAVPPPPPGPALTRRPAPAAAAANGASCVLCVAGGMRTAGCPRRPPRPHVRRGVGTRTLVGEAPAWRRRKRPGHGTPTAAPGLPARAARDAHTLPGSTALLLQLHLP